MLVEPTINNQKLTLAPEERKAYNNILDYHNRLIDFSVSRGDSVGAFQTVLKLRVFCNNGLYGKKDLRASPTDLLTSEEYSNFLQENHISQSPSCDSGTLFLGPPEISDTETLAEYSNSIGGHCRRISPHSGDMPELGKLEYHASELLNAPGVFRESVTPENLSSIDQPPQASEAIFSTKHRAILRTIRGHLPQEKGYA